MKRKRWVDVFVDGKMLMMMFVVGDAGDDDHFGIVVDDSFITLILPSLLWGSNHISSIKK